MKKQFVSPLLIILAMLLLIIPKIIDAKPFDLLGYGAIGIIILATISIYIEYKKLK